MHNTIEINTEHGVRELLFDDNDKHINQFKDLLGVVSLNDTMYVVINHDAGQIMLHSLIGRLSLHHAFMFSDGEAFYHANGNTFDNRSENIILGKVKMKGASFDKRAKAWRSQIWLDGKVKHLGHFKTPEEASMQYYKYRDEHKEQRKYKTT